MTYDQWKTDSGYDERDDDDDYTDVADCCHEDHDADALTGRAHCHRCGHAWWMTANEIRAEIEHQARFHEWAERENRKQWWRDQVDRIAFWRRWRKPVAVTDDDLPF